MNYRNFGKKVFPLHRHALRKDIDHLDHKPPSLWPLCARDPPVSAQNKLLRQIVLLVVI